MPDIPNITPHEQICLYAMRYALGKRSYAAPDVALYIRHKLPDASEDFLRFIHDELKERIERHYRDGYSLGSKGDVAEWETLFEACKLEISKRKTANCRESHNYISPDKCTWKDDKKGEEIVIRY